MHWQRAGAMFNNHGNRQNNIASLILEKRLLILILSFRHVPCVKLHRKTLNLIFQLGEKKARQFNYKFYFATRIKSIDNEGNKVLGRSKKFPKRREKLRVKALVKI